MRTIALAFVAVAAIGAAQHLRCPNCGVQLQLTASVEQQPVKADRKLTRRRGDGPDPTKWENGFQIGTNDWKSWKGIGQSVETYRVQCEPE